MNVATSGSSAPGIHCPGRFGVLAAGLATIAGLILAGSSGAAAAQAPQAVRTALVPAADAPVVAGSGALPTWQINGVVWAAVTVGDTVYATGSFSKARPPGTDPGDPAEIPAGNIFAFDVTTGEPVPAFSHSLNAQGLSVAAAPDGSRIYVGGDFTSVDGLPRHRIAAFSTSTGKLLSAFHPSVTSRVSGIAATSKTVYLGGRFTSVSGVARTRLAALSAASGKVSAWKPTADGPGDADVTTMVVSPNGARVIVGGHFKTLNHRAAYGMGALSVKTGSTLPWAANTVIRDAGVNGAITRLTADATQVYGGGYAFGKGATWEGTFALNPTNGKIVWLNDCHGDTYDVFATGGVLYSVGHAHDCSAIGGFGDTSPRTYHRALASTSYPTGTNTGPDQYGWNYAGRPAASLLAWQPDLANGSYTGQNQAAWAVTGNAAYVVLGGEFPTVNGVAQQGLARFAIA